MRWTASRLPLPTPASSELAPHDLSSDPGRSRVAVSSLQASDDPGAGVQRGSLSLPGAHEPSGTGCNGADSLQLLLQDAPARTAGFPREASHLTQRRQRGQGQHVLPPAPHSQQDTCPAY